MESAKDRMLRALKDSVQALYDCDGDKKKTESILGFMKLTIESICEVDGINENDL